MKKILLIISIIPFFVKAQIVTTVAGGGTSGLGDGGPATAANIGYIVSVAFDTSGNLFIADGNHNRIRKVDAITGIIITVAGNGTAGFAGDSAAATSAELNSPSYIAFDKFDNLYIADAPNRRVRKVNAFTGIITTIAGNGVMGFTGDGGPATAAELYTPQGLTLDLLGNLYITDLGAERIRKVDTFGNITTVAGNGVAGYGGNGGLATSAELHQPQDVATDAAGNLYIADYANNRVRKVDFSTGIINTVAGDSSGGYNGDQIPATTAELDGLFGITFDVSSNLLYIADFVNNRIRKVDSLGIIHTVAGNGITGFSGDGGLADTAELNRPEGIAFDRCGNLYIADKENKRVRKVIFDSTCSYGSDTTHTDTTNAVQNVEANTFKVYPNPAIKDLTLTLSINGEGINSVALYNMLGQVVYNKAFVQQKKITIDISALPVGMYFIKVNGVGVQKVLKE